MEDYLLAVFDLSITIKEETCIKSNLFVQIEKYSKILQIWLIQGKVIKVFSKFKILPTLRIKKCP